MNAVDGSEHYEVTSTAATPSLLVIVLDTNPHAWALLKSTLPLPKAIANILVFINAHLAFNNANQVAVIASHSHRAAWLYPTSPSMAESVSEDVEMSDGPGTASNIDDANKYRPFALIEDSLLTSLRSLISTTTEDDVGSTSTTQMAGALTLALSYINKASTAYSGIATEEKPLASTAENKDVVGLQSRILVVSVSGDLAHQYIPIMNTTFAAQRLRIPIDILKLAGDTVFLQQASDATKGVYMQLRNPEGLLQYLMMAFLPDQMARKHLIAPTQEVVDFRAACFCHRRVVDIGFVCSICLSIFCSPPEGAICLTCSTHLALGDYGSKPAVVPRKKKKKKKINGAETGSARGTPAPGE
ncbi:related to basic transcription factor 2 (35 kd SU) [Rhynchosporium agropyri]|uniref:General transcription and DNA repair factor IIH subunit TFB4 n=3 Tax=Rhynchosporium TaxID=38037 RepID=A0A1E1M9V2_RHYSE|nr:related to basic transcription factor 2 (35 kd SU) [Rhynchosporium agropyri]CZS96548.1 related to basic transcription factor 2 (35 kd SU) [Rhynchosporium commune]CZT45880.1 related to basic transcription factor 2 (35 kd SU) [Rhynchosporium secalis]